MTYPVGKLPSKVLEELLARNVVSDPKVLVGPSVGQDAAVIDFGQTLLVAKTDPITFATDEIGWYAVNVNANDIATMGARPRWFLATLLLPGGKAGRHLVDGIYDDILRACEHLGIALVGGHTEITYGLTRPILAGQMLGEVARDRLVTGDRVAPGDRVLLTKAVAVEGTAIIAREKRSELADLFEEATLKRCSNFLHDPGISVVEEAMAACRAGGVKAMHDPTEGGLATGVWELARQARLGARIRLQEIAVFEETRRFCDHFRLDPLGLIASGSLLIVAEPEATEAISERVETAGIKCREIGEMTSEEQGLALVTPEGERAWPVFERDEIARLFE